MAYVVLIAEGDASETLKSTWAEKSQRLRTHTGALVLYDTNLAREFVKDVKKRISNGKLVVFRCDDPHETIEPGVTS